MPAPPIIYDLILCERFGWTLRHVEHLPQDDHIRISWACGRIDAARAKVQTAAAARAQGAHVVDFPDDE